ncbi:MAG: Ig-like domain-containing protein [Clostridium sp.]|nr:Ig-like domain-containing protein [Clostridium sp.]
MKNIKRIAAIVLALVMVVGIFAVSVSAAEATGVKLSATTLTIGVGESKSVTATLTPAGSTTSKKTWKSASTSVATVDSTGKITGKKAGTATISVTTAGGKTASVKVTVKAAPTKLALASALTLYVGQTSTPAVTTTPSNAQTTRTWKSSNTAVATVDSGGKITPLKVGTCYITVTSYNNKTSNKLKLTVKAKPAPTKIAPAASSVTVDATLTSAIKLTYTPYYANTSVKYTSSNTKVATVSASGVIKGVAKGTAKITVYSYAAKKNMATITVTVRPAPTGVKVTSKTTLTLGAGQTSTIASTVSPADARNTRTYKSSNTAVATVDSTGKIAARKYGTATITVSTWNGKSAKITVNAYNAPTAVTYKLGTLTSATLGVGQTVTPTTAFTGTNLLYTRTYTSSKTAVATVDSTGKITAKGVGTATITVTTWNKQTATFKVTVVAKPTSITGFTTAPTTIFSGNSATIAKPYITVVDHHEWYYAGTGWTATRKKNTGLAALLSEYAHHSDERDVTRNDVWSTAIYGTKWTSSNTAVATVDANGKVTAKTVTKKSTANITLQYWNGVKKTITVTVLPKPTSVKLNTTKAALVSAQTLQLSATATPADSATYTTTANGGWSSSNTAVATVSSTGKVTAVGAGTATITFAYANSVKATCAVTVESVQGALNSYNNATKLFTDSAVDFVEKGAITISNINFSTALDVLIAIFGMKSEMDQMKTEMSKPQETEAVENSKTAGQEKSLVKSSLAPGHIKSGGATVALVGSNKKYTFNIVNEKNPTGNCALAAFTANIFGKEEMKQLIGLDQMAAEEQALVDTLLGGLDITTQNVQIVAEIKPNGQFASVKHSVGMHIDFKLPKDLVIDAADQMGYGAAAEAGLLLFPSTIDILTLDITMTSDWSNFVYH